MSVRFGLCREVLSLTHAGYVLFRIDEKKKKKRKKAAKSTLSFNMDGEEGEDNDSAAGAVPSTSKPPATEDSRMLIPLPPLTHRLMSISFTPAPPAKRAKLKNPTVDTSFLPDREREEEERRAREELRKEWIKSQEEMKKEEIEITCSYWDGSGHRMSVKVCFTMSLAAHWC